MLAARNPDGGWSSVLAQNFTKGDVVEVLEGRLQGKQGELRSVRRSQLSVSS
jgi:ribosomal protein L24